MSFYIRTATRMKSNSSYRISEKQRQDRANFRFKDEVDGGLWRRDGKSGKDFHKRNATPKIKR